MSPVFPGFTATTAPPRISGAARATNIGALTRTSAQARFSGLGAFGRGISAVGDIAFRASQNRQAIDDTIEWGTATSRTKDRFRLAEAAAERMDVSLDMPLPDDPDYLKTLQSFSTDARDNFLAEALKDIEGDVNKINTGFKSEKNKAQFTNWYNDNYGNMANRVRAMYDRKLDSYQRSEMDRLRETAAKNGDLETADKFTVLMDKYELITPERAEALKKNNKIISDMSITTQMAQAIMQVNGYQEAVEFVMDQDIDRAIKENIIGDIKFDAAQQKLAFDKQLEKAEIGYLANLEKEQLSEDELMADLQAGRINTDLYKEYKNYVDAQADERLKGEVELNYDTYDKLVGMIEGYGNKKISKDEVRQEISKEVGVNISTTIARSLRDKLAAKDKPDDPMNKAIAKRSMSFLTELKNDDFFWPADVGDSDEELREAARQNNINYLKLSNELEQWIVANPDATDEEITNKTNELTQPFIEEVVLNWFEKLILAKETTPFFGRFTGTTEEKRLATKKRQAGIKEAPERIEVEKDGKRYTIPQEQLAEAEKQGYRRTK